MAFSEFRFSILSQKYAAQPILLLPAQTAWNNNRETHLHICIFRLWKPIKRTLNRNSVHLNVMVTNFVFMTIIGFKFIILTLSKPVCAKKRDANLFIDNISACHRSSVFILSFIYSLLFTVCLVRIFVVPNLHCFGCIKWISVCKDIFTHSAFLSLRVALQDAFCRMCFCHQTQCLVPHLKWQKQVYCYLTLRFIIFFIFFGQLNNILYLLTLK